MLRLLRWFNAASTRIRQGCGIGVEASVGLLDEPETRAAGELRGGQTMALEAQRQDTETAAVRVRETRIREGKGYKNRTEVRLIKSSQQDGRDTRGGQRVL